MVRGAFGVIGQKLPIVVSFWTRETDPFSHPWIADIDLAVVVGRAEQESIARVSDTKAGIEWQEFKAQLWSPGMIMQAIAAAGHEIVGGLIQCCVSSSVFAFVTVDAFGFRDFVEEASGACKCCSQRCTIRS